jgi:hypothetical protein
MPFSVNTLCEQTAQAARAIRAKRAALQRTTLVESTTTNPLLRGYDAEA